MHSCRSSCLHYLFRNTSSWIITFLKVEQRRINSGHCQMKRWKECSTMGKRIFTMKNVSKTNCSKNFMHRAHSKITNDWGRRHTHTYTQTHTPKPNGEVKVQACARILFIQGRKYAISLLIMIIRNGITKSLNEFWCIIDFYVQIDALREHWECNEVEHIEKLHQRWREKNHSIDYGSIR